ncbi:MAG: metalloregulator ArsR/SmtB family transcription factor [bacterium]|nr:metalloregulator ArsR/SmtB family transcription factor [bacterium]
MKQSIQEPYKIFFETLGNETRWEIVQLLRGKKKYRATDISKFLKYEQSLTSHHLRRLEMCGFVKVERSGKERIYQLNEETIGPLLEIMEAHINKFCKKLCKNCV